MSIFKNNQQKQTYSEILELLQKHGKCAVERPVGFGKTWMFSKISSLYKRVLFIVPNHEIERAIENDYRNIRCKDIRFHTYYGLGRKWKQNMLDDILIHKFDLIVLDELHCAGADLARCAIKEIIPKLKHMGIHILGGTATNDRSDGYDPIVDMFDNIQPFIYTMENMLIDGLAPIPHYTYSTFGRIDNIKRYFQGILQDLPVHLSQAEFEANMKSIEVSLANRANACDVIKEAIKNVYNEPLDYMKFLVYFPTIRVLEEKMDEIKEAFEIAFPDMYVRTLIVHSGGRYNKNIRLVEEYRHTSNTIDLILTINQLNLGYHVEDLTGVCLMRLTRSAIIGKQQAYRPISVGSNHPGIIIDFVNCLHKEFIFDTPPPASNQRSTPGTDPLRNMRVATVHINNRIADIHDMMHNLEGIISATAEKEICEMYDMSGMPIDIIVKKLGKGSNRSRVRNVLLKAGMIDNRESRLTLYGKVI
jgi:SAM-dependent methyltransferase